MTFISLFLLSTSAPAVFAAPSPQEFARAIGAFTDKHVKVADVRRLSCKAFGADEPTEAECRWQQRTGSKRTKSKWKSYSTYVAVDRSGWHLIDQPSPKR